MVMIQPDELRTERPYGPCGSRGCDVWDAISAAVSGDVAALRGLLERDPNIARYHQPIHFAACGGHLEAVRVMLDGDADPDAEFNGADPVTAARARGHEVLPGCSKTHASAAGGPGQPRPITRTTRRPPPETSPACARFWTRSPGSST